MTFNRLYFNRGILIQNFRQHGWIGILYLFALLFAVPLHIATEYREVPQEIASLFLVNGEAQLLFAITFPVVAGLFIFRYLQSGGPADLFHSLPLRREHLLTVNLFSGFILLLVPIWLTVGITGWVWAAQAEPAFIFGGAEIWMWGLSMTIYTLFMFMLTVAIGMCIGQTVLQGLTVYAILLLPVVVWGVFELHLQHYLLGFPSEAIGRYAEKISLVTRVASISSVPPYTIELTIYGILTVIFILLSYVLYARRKVESATQAVTFRIVKPVFRFGFMFTLVLIGGAYFEVISPEGSSGWGIMGYVLGGIVGYIGAEMIIRKTWLIWDTRLLPQFAVYGIVAGLILYVPVADWNGYASRVPEPERVQSVKLGGDYYVYVDGVYLKSDDSHLYSDNPEYIGAVLALHEKIVTSDLPLPANSSSMDRLRDETVMINYQLDNGKTMQRKYQIPEEEFRQELKAIKETDEYKRVAYSTDLLDGDVRSIGLSSNVSGNRKAYISNPGQIREFKALLKQDVLNQTYDDQLTPWSPKFNVEVYALSDAASINQQVPMTYYEIKPSYKQTIEWLKQHGQYEQLEVSPDEISSAQFVKEEINSPGKFKWVYAEENFMNGSPDGSKQVATNNKKIIGDLLERQRSAFYTDQDVVYHIKLNVDRGESIYMMLKQEDLTKEMKEILAEQ